MISFKKLPQSDLKQASHLLAHSFKDYDYFKLLIKDDEKRLRYLQEMLEVLVKQVNQKGHLIASYKNDKLMAVAALQAPDQREPSIWDYLCSGGIGLVLRTGLKPNLDILKLERLAHQDLEKLKQPFWYLAALAVAPEAKGQGLGSRTIQEGILPFLKSNKAGYLAFITNSEVNRRFYQKNGFREFAQGQVSLNQTSIGNWSYIMAL